jgi:hypothetical protein
MCHKYQLYIKYFIHETSGKEQNKADLTLSLHARSKYCIKMHITHIISTLQETTDAPHRHVTYAEKLERHQPKQYLSIRHKTLCIKLSTQHS